jgi:hypothetical protein
MLPEESQDITEAMQLVDQRMYAQKTAAAARPTARAATCVVDAFSELVVELAWPTAPAPSEVSGGGAR